MVTNSGSPYTTDADRQKDLGDVDRQKGLSDADW